MSRSTLAPGTRTRSAHRSRPLTGTPPQRHLTGQGSSTILSVAAGLVLSAAVLAPPAATVTAVQSVHVRPLAHGTGARMPKAEQLCYCSVADSWWRVAWRLPSRASAWASGLSGAAW